VAKGKEHPGQYDFMIDGELQTPEFLFDHIGRDVTDVIGSRKIWKGRKGLCVFDDISKKRHEIFKPNSWQITKEPYLKPVDGVVVVHPPLEIGNFEELVEYGINAAQNLKKGSPFMLLEERGSSLNKNDRLDALSEIGLVNRSVLNSLTKQFILSEGRKEAERRKREPIDLLDKTKYPKALEAARRDWTKMVRMYQNIGYEIVDAKNSPIIARLHASRLVRNDYKLLEKGYGVKVKNIYCGCIYDVDLEGEWKEEWNCGGDHDFLDRIVPDKKINKNKK